MIFCVAWKQYHYLPIVCLNFYIGLWQSNYTQRLQEFYVEHYSVLKQILQLFAWR